MQVGRGWEDFLNRIDPKNFKEYLTEKDLDHQHQMEAKRHRLLVTGQIWAGFLATLGVVGSVVALLIGREGWAASVMSAEFVTLIGLFLYNRARKDVAPEVEPNRSSTEALEARPR